MPLQEDAARFIHPEASVSDNIRALAAAGYSRADIARILNKRYQHVRNVLEAEKLKGVKPAIIPSAANSPPLSSGTGIYRLALGLNGEIVLPETVEMALGLVRGGVAIAEFDGESLVIMSSSAALRRAQDFVRSLGVPQGVSLADELIVDRRRDAELEGQDG